MYPKFSESELLKSKLRTYVTDLPNDEEELENLQKEINKSNEALNKNLRYKCVLTENGSVLVDIVFDILQKIFAYDLSSFKDEKKEDFLIFFITYYYITCWISTKTF